MKKLFILTSASLFALFAQAQITKGSILLGGSLNFNQSKSDGSSSNINSTYWGIAPSFGIALKENLVYGINLNYNHNQSSSNTYAGGIFLRKYYPLGNNFYLFGEPSLNYSHQESKVVTPISDNSVYKFWSVDLGLRPGISYALSRKFQLETGLGNLVDISYSKSKTEYFNTTTPAPPSKVSQFGLSSSLSSTVQLNVGLRFLIAK